MIAFGLFGGVLLAAGLLMMVFPAQVNRFFIDRPHRMLFISKSARATYPDVTFRILGAFAVAMGLLALTAGVLIPLLRNA